MSVLVLCVWGVGGGERWSRREMEETIEKFTGSSTVILCYFLKMGPIEQPMWSPSNSGDVKESVKIMLCSLKHLFRTLLKALRQADNLSVRLQGRGLEPQGPSTSGTGCSQWFYILPETALSLPKAAELARLQEPSSGYCWGLHWWKTRM